MKIKVLCSGFEPFGGLEVNPTVQLVKELEEQQPWANIELKSIQLPVIYETCAQSLLEAIEKEKPDIIISCGLAYGRSAISLERIGINIQDTKGEGEKGDNTGEKPVDKPIQMNGPDGLFSTLPFGRCWRLFSKTEYRLRFQIQQVHIFVIPLYTRFFIFLEKKK
nr:hypothetical protein [Thalassobacillus sp. C254]